MTEVRAKDKLFLAVALPLAALAFYIYGWRFDAAKRFDALTERHAKLVKAEDFDFEKTAAERTLRAAEEELAAEKAVPPPVVKVKADAQASAAEREREVLAVFRAAGLRVVATERTEPQAGAALLGATGTRPEPVSRSYRLDGRYPEVRAALEAFARDEKAVIVEKLDMEESGSGRWKLEVSL